MANTSWRRVSISMGATVTGLSGAWFVAWGSIVAATDPPQSKPFWIAATYVASAAFIVGLILLIVGERTPRDRPHNSTFAERRKVRQEADKKASPKGFGVSVRAYARHDLLNWTPAYEQESSGSVRCKVYSGDGDKRHLDTCQVTSPSDAVSVARTIPREPQAFFAFDYPSQFEGLVATLPLADGEYRVEWNEVGGGLIRIHAFTIVNGRLGGDGSTP